MQNKRQQFGHLIRDEIKPSQVEGFKITKFLQFCRLNPELLSKLLYFSYFIQLEETIQCRFRYFACLLGMLWQRDVRLHELYAYKHDLKAGVVSETVEDIVVCLECRLC